MNLRFLYLTFLTFAFPLLGHFALSAELSAPSPIVAEAVAAEEPDLSETDARLFAEKSCIRRGMLPALCRSVAKIESHWNPRAVSPVGAIGIMQIMPANARRCGHSDHRKLHEMKENIECGAQMLDEDIRSQGGNAIKGLQQYNGGPRCVKIIEKCGSNLRCMGYQSPRKRGCAESYFFAELVVGEMVRDLG